MGRKKLQVKKIDDQPGRSIRYSKRRDGMVKKASELSVLCDTEVGLVMFSPTGRLTSFASNGRIEDIFLRYMGCPDDLQERRVENEEYYIKRLMDLKYERRLLEKMTELEAIEEKVKEVNKKQCEAHQKLRSYNPDTETITSIREAEMLEQHLVDAIQSIQQLKEKLLNNHPMETMQGCDENKEQEAADVNDNREVEIPDMDTNNNLLRNKYNEEDVENPNGPHLSIQFLREQTHWNLGSAGTSY